MKFALGAEAWRVVAIASGIVSLAVVIFLLVGSSRGVYFVLVGRYVAWLTRRLRRLHVFRPATQIVHVQVGLGLVVGALAVFGLCPYWYLVLLAIGSVPALVIERRIRERIERLDRQADGFCLALANALKSTASIGAAIETAASLLDGPAAEEIQLAVKETRLGRSLSEALEAVGPRSASRKLAIVLAAVLVGRQVGGNLPRVLETTATTLREMERLEGVVRQKTADGRMQMWAISIAPIAICAAIQRLDHDYFTPLTTTTAGYLCVAVALVLYVAGLLVARKILAVDL